MLFKCFDWLEFIVHPELSFILHKLHLKLCVKVAIVRVTLRLFCLQVSNPQSLSKSLGHMTQYKMDLDHIVVFS